MAKESVGGSKNPALEFHRKAKKSLIAKSKADRTRIRDARLSRRRPDQLQAQIDELVQIQKDGKINATDKKIFVGLEKDISRLQKLRADGRAVPIITSERTQRQEEKELKRNTKIPKHPQRSIYYDSIMNPYGVPPPGMPYREIDDDEEVDVEEDSEADSVSVTSSIANIPMPAGTPPALLEDEAEEEGIFDKVIEATQICGPSERLADEYLGEIKRTMQDQAVTDPAVTSAAIQISYSSEPVVRDLRREAVGFVPKAVRRRGGHPVQRFQQDPLTVDIAGEITPAVAALPRPNTRKIDIAPGPRNL